MIIHEHKRLILSTTILITAIVVFVAVNSSKHTVKEANPLSPENMGDWIPVPVATAYRNCLTDNSIPHATIDPFNDQLPTSLAKLINDPQNQGLTPAQLEDLFARHTTVPVKLSVSATNILLAAIADFPCPTTHYASDREARQRYYIIQPDGHLDAVATLPGVTDRMEWIVDRWMLVIKQFASNAPEGDDHAYYSVWSVTSKANQWQMAKTVDIGLWKQPEINYMNGYGELTTTTGPVWGNAMPAPCEQITHIKQYLYTSGNIVNQYQWRTDHYERVTTKAVPDTVVLRGETNGSTVVVTDWQSLCEVPGNK